MQAALVIIIIIGITGISIIGSWYAKKANNADMLIGLHVTFTLVAQILAVKISVIQLYIINVNVPTGIIVFSVTFLITDIVNEKFGRKKTQTMILVSFVSQIAMMFFFFIGARTEPASFWKLQDAWVEIFNFVPRITVASWCAFIVSENLDAYVFSFVKEITKGKHLWMRNGFSSIPALAVDSLIFVPLAFGGKLPIWDVIFGQIILKWIIGVINIPFMYINRWIMFYETNK
jgi:hypothetical protein